MAPFLCVKVRVNPEILPSASDKAKLLGWNFSKNLNLMTQVSLNLLSLLDLI